MNHPISIFSLSSCSRAYLACALLGACVGGAFALGSMATRPSSSALAPLSVRAWAAGASWLAGCAALWARDFRRRGF